MKKYYNSPVKTFWATWFVQELSPIKMMSQKYVNEWQRSWKNPTVWQGIWNSYNAEDISHIRSSLVFLCCAYYEILSQYIKKNDLKQEQHNLTVPLVSIVPLLLLMRVLTSLIYTEFKATCKSYGSYQHLQSSLKL